MCMHMFSFENVSAVMIKHCMLEAGYTVTKTVLLTS
jgi:hypothetical protein